MCYLPASEEALDHFDLFVFAEGGVGVGQFYAFFFLAVSLFKGIRRECLDTPMIETGFEKKKKHNQLFKALSKQKPMIVKRQKVFPQRTFYFSSISSRASTT